MPKAIHLVAHLFMIGLPAFFSTGLAGQELQFNHFTIENGLPQNTVNAIIQDRKGFMWFGTQDGLCRFDGYKFRVFRHDPQKNSIANNYIWSIYEDREGILWIATFGGGLSRFDPATEHFTPYKSQKNGEPGLANNNTFAIEEVNGVLWIGTNDGLSSLDKSTGKIKNYLQSKLDRKGMAGNFIGTVAFQKPGTLWFNCDSGLTRMDTDRGKFEFLGNRVFGLPFTINGTRHIRCLNEKLLIACDTGLVELDPDRKTGRVLINHRDLETERRAVFSSIFVAQNGKYWIGTSQGLLVFDPSSDSYRLYRHMPNEPGSLANNTVLSVYRSASGVCWIGTRLGLDKLDKEQSEFFLLRHSPGSPHSLSNKSVGAIAEDGRGMIWIGTPDGLNAYDRTKKNIRAYRADSSDRSSLSSSYILSMLRDNEQNLWIGTRGGGINLLAAGEDLAKPGFRQYRLNNKTIQHICQGDGQTLWLGSSGGGLLKFDRKTGSTKEYPANQDGTGPSHPYVYFIFIDSFGNMWLGTPTGGLNLFDPIAEKFIYIRNQPENLHSLSNNIVLTIFEDRSHRLWVGTSGGLNRLSIPLARSMFSHFEKKVNLEKDSLFDRFGIADGLPNDVIYGILQDDKNFLWLTTNNGLVKFDPSGPRPIARTYDVKDGIQNNEFNQNTYYRNSRGEFYIGGVDGFNIFHPDSLKINSQVPPVVITDFKLYNEPAPIGDKGRYGFSLKKSITETELIRLAYHHDVISFEFAALNYVNTAKNRYQYKLEGFDKDWVDAGGIRSATYTNLDAGSYVFRVRASNNDGIWNQEGASIRLVVPPPPWLSWYAYLAYSALFASAIYFFIRQREKATRRKFEAEAAIERAKTEERESFRKKSSQDFHDEAGNRITKINLFTELAKSEAGDNPALKKYLDKIDENTAGLSSGMRDFIWVMDPAKDSAFETILRLKEFGDSIFTEAGADFTMLGLHARLHDLKMPMEARRAIIQVFKEAMNNCAKYAKARTIVLSVSGNNRLLEIELSDDGCGFNPENTRSKGYGLNIMKERAANIGADLELSSGNSQGTRITLRYNIPQMGD